ncbi:hypothetical protein KVMX100_120324 [Klebsiella variicola]|nr:hypothetical protein KVMX100_120324 [Klebsiella variicola]
MSLSMGNLNEKTNSDRILRRVTNKVNSH